MPKKTAEMKSEQVVTIDDIFGPRGLLEKRHNIMIEAGTGTGKTLAYLIPAIRSGRRVIVSTATKSLQEQLFQKDVPFLQKHFAPNLKAALMKGRTNFLCREKVHQMVGHAVLKGIDEIDWFSQIKDWA